MLSNRGNDWLVVGRAVNGAHPVRSRWKTLEYICSYDPILGSSIDTLNPSSVSRNKSQIGTLTLKNANFLGSVGVF
jgi:hypothetical protein